MTLLTESSCVSTADVQYVFFFLCDISTAFEDSLQALKFESDAGAGELRGLMSFPFLLAKQFSSAVVS